MSLTCGFYNSLNYDRRYTAEQLSSIFTGVINDGVFMSIGDQLRVSASDKMTVIVGSGRAWFNGTWTDNDADYAVTIPVSELVLHRIDAIVLEVNSSESVRANSIKVVSGTPATNPSRPTLTNSSTVHQYPLAYVTVNAGVTSIKQSDITNAVGTSECPWVTGILETINTDELITQWKARFDELYATLENAIEQTLAAEVVDGSVTMPKLASDVVSELNGKLSTFVTPTGANTLSFTVKGAGSSTSNAWRRQMLTVQAWSQGADFTSIQLMVDIVNGAPYGGTPCFVTFERNLPVTSIVYSTEGNDTTYTITFKADAMWALGYVTYKNGLGMSVVAADVLESGTSVVVKTHVGHVMEYAKKVGAPRNLLDNSDFRNPVNQRGQMIYYSGYGFDRWRIYAPNTSMEYAGGGIRITGAGIWQNINVVAGNTYTLAAQNTDGVISVAVGNFVSGSVSPDRKVQFNATVGTPSVFLAAGDWVWIALYEGEYTIDTLPEYQPKGYEQELLICRQYDPSTGEYIGLRKFGQPRNLLDNSDFRNPVMQAGLNGFHGISKYPIDRWISWESDITLNDGYISVATPIDQRVSLDIVDVHKKYTAALCLSNGQIRCDCATFENTIGSYGLGVYCYAPDGEDYVTVRIASNTDVKWVALYEGEYTLDTLPEYQPKGYGAELAECQRYYLHNVGQFLSGSFMANSNSFRVTVPLPVPMRVNPTVTLVNGDSIIWAYGGQSKTTKVIGVTEPLVYPRGIVVNLTTEDNPGAYVAGHTFTTTLCLSADL